ncbi:MAG TPA: ABC transporter permease [Candidatus Dormibacteraeota bacterium]|nr:ABC transporter permease [Candidatus Dormibacteraeota bacterium]
MPAVSRHALPAAIPLGLTAAWEVIARALGYDSFPPPDRVLPAFWELLSTGALWTNTAHTLAIVLAAWVVSGVTGITVGLAIGLVRPAWRMSQTSIEFLRFIPPVALIPVVIIIYGFSNTTELVVAAYAAVWPVILNTGSGVAQVDRRLLEVGRLLRLGPLDVVRKLVLPSALPAIAVGLRLSLAISLIVVVTTEMVGVPDGLGFQLVSSSQALHQDRVYAYVVWIGNLGLLLAVLALWAERLVMPWRRPVRAEL